MFVILAFTALMLLVGRQKGYPVRKNSGPKSLGTVVNVKCAEYSLKYHVGVKSFGLTFENAEDKNDWGLRIKEATS